MVTYRTGAEGRLYCMLKSVDDRPSIIWRRYDVYIYTKNRHNFLQETVLLKKERLRLTLTVMKVKTTLAQDCKHSNSTCSFYVINHKPIKRNIFLVVFIFWSSEVKYLLRCNMHVCKYTTLLKWDSSTNTTSTGARKGIVRCPDGHRPIC